MVGSLGAGRWLAVLSDTTSPFAGCVGNKATRGLTVALLAYTSAMVSCTSETPQREVTASPILESVGEEVAVLGNRSGEDGEVDLTVVIDGDHPDHCSCLAVAGKEHGPGTDTVGSDGIGEGRPAETFVVLGVQVDFEIKVLPGSPVRSGQNSR